MKKWWSKRGVWIAGLMAFGALSMTGCQEKKTEIVWYLENPQWNGVDLSEVEPYQEIQNERFDLFNKRLEELGIPAKVVFKYDEEEWGMDMGKPDAYPAGIKISSLLEKDQDADIRKFSEVEYDKFIELDEYFQEEGMGKAKEAIPDIIWKVNEIRGKTYQIPRGLASVQESTYMFHSAFLEKYQIELDESQIRQMTPKEVIQWLQPYFKEQAILDKQFYLTSSEDLYYEFYYQDCRVPLIETTSNNLSLDVENLEVFPQVWEVAELYQWIYDENIDAHSDLGRDAAWPVFRVGACDMWEADPQRQQEKDDTYYQVRLENQQFCRNIGNGVLKTSHNKELAVQVLAASMYDEELSNLMIHGIQGKDYELEDGRVVYLNEKMDTRAGTLSEVGNYMISYPKQVDFLNKQETIEERLKTMHLTPKMNFVPTWTEVTWNQATEIADVCNEILIQSAYYDIDNMEAYRKEQEQKLEDLGINELIAELQKQVEQWED